MNRIPLLLALVAVLAAMTYLGRDEMRAVEHCTHTAQPCRKI